MRVRNWLAVFVFAMSALVCADGVQAGGSPTISALSITTGAVGASVTITGTNFGTSQGTSTVKFNGTTATATSWGASSIVVTVPTGATTGNVVVTVANKASNGLAFTVVPAPSISTLSITSGAVGATVTITGTSFGASQGTGTVTFNGIVATVTSWNATSIAVTVPGSATTGNVVVNASGVASNGKSFTVTPNITSLSISTGVVGSAVTITGTTFGTTGTVAFNGTAASTTSWSSTSIGVTVPSGATTGNVVVTVNGVASNAKSFTVTPNITNLSIITGAFGAPVTITGTTFGTTGTVTFNGTPASATSWTSTSIAVTVPSGATTGSVVVTVGGVASNGYGFTVVQAPSVTSLSINTGAVGAAVTITGTGFGTGQGTGTVTFNGTAANVTSWASTSIAATVPNAATTGNVVVNTAGVASNGMGFTVVPAPNITNLSLTSGPIGSPITITGTNFGSTQGTVSFNGIGATPTSWSATSIGVTVPGGATTGNVVVNASGVASNGINFIVSTLPSGWLDQDIGSVGTAGTANYSSGVFTVQGAGAGFVGGTIADAFHFAYRTLTGDGTIVARIANISGGQAAVMLRETLNPNSTTMSPGNWAGNALFYRTTTGSAMASVSASGNFPYWFKVTRSGNILTAYIAPDGVNWVKVSTSQTINMAQTIYVGLGVASGNGDLSTVTFDGVSLNSTANPAPVITSVSATTGSVGSQVIVTGQNFGALQGNSSVFLHGAATTINSWSNTSITLTIPTGATSGYLVVSVAPSMNDSNPVDFTVTTNPLPSGWLDQDIGYDGQPGSSTYSNGVFTIVGGGNSPENAVHFDYRVLSGDGTIIARVASVSNNGWGGVMMRDGLNSLDSSIFLCGCNGANLLWSRSVSGGTLTQIGGQPGGFPYWVKLVRTGTDFVGYISADGVSWTPVGGSVPISMSQSIYVGLWGTGNGGTVTFDDVSLSTQANPAPVISSLSATTGPVGTQVIISGSGFGASQGSSIATLNDLPVTISLWSDTSIAVTIPSGATSGSIVVVRGPSMDSSNPESFYVTSSPLPSGWFDLDIGANRLWRAGSATYSSGVFTVNGSSLATGGSGDGLHFVYQPITADFTIIARITSLNQFARAGVMIRQTLDSNSQDAVIYSYPSGSPAFSAEFDYRTSYGGPLGALSLGTGSLGWVKLIRAADTFTAFYSPDGINWTQVGTTQTIQSTQAVYAGIATTTGGGTGLGTATIDNVSITLGGTLPNPLITGLSRMSGAPGSLVTISGSGFGATQGASTANFNGVASSTVYSWSDTQIQAAVPDGATTGPVSVVVGNITGNGPNFTVTFAATVTDSLGNQTAYNSSLFGGQWAFTSAQGSGCSSCTVRGTTQSQYDSQGRLVWTIDALGHGVVYRYDSSNNLISQQVEGDSNTPTATTTYANYTSLGEPQTVTDPLGQVTHKVTANTYDIHGNLTSVTTPAPNGSTSGSLTQFGYNPLGQLVTITDPLNNATTLTYTPVGLIATITDMQGNVTTYDYDPHGNRTSVMDALHHQTIFAYDAGDRLKLITYPDTTTTGFGYDYRGRRTDVTDQNGKITRYGYDDADRLISVTDAAIPPNVTTYAYDTENNLTSITDANQNQTVFAYDPFGRVKQTNFPSSQIETYAYDANNNLISKTDRKNQTIQYVYDVLNRLTRKIYPDSTEADYVYDLVGKIQQVNDPTGNYTFAYDNMGRLIGTTTNYSFLPGKTFTNGYSYDAASNRTGFTDPETGSTTYAYDTLNRLQTLTPPAAISGGSFGFSYDALSRRTQMTRPNSVTTNYGYDNLSHLLSVLHQVSGSTIDGASYTVDSAGNRTAKTDQRLALATNYGYDSIYQLLSATQSGSTTENYTYDPVGNRLSSLGVASYTNNSSNELTATSNASYGYDLNGNAITKNDSTGITNYAWDFENRMTSVTLPGTGGTVSFKYDPLGRRIYKSSSSVTSIYTYDGINLIEETTSTGSVVARYSQGPSVDEPLAMLRSGASSFYNADGLGSITSLANSSGSLAQTYTFDSFGKLTASSGSLTNPFQYTSRESDGETNLYYLRARYFDSAAGRFLSEDLLGFSGGKDFYTYVLNNPANLIDPVGLDPWPYDLYEKLRKKLKKSSCVLAAFGCRVREQVESLNAMNVDAIVNTAEAQQQNGGEATGNEDFQRLQGCLKADRNCQLALELCIRLALTNPFPPPSWMSDIINYLSKHGKDPTICADGTCSGAAPPLKRP